MKKIYIFFMVLFSLFVNNSISYSEETPSWILMPEKEGFTYCSVGFAAKSSNASIQKKIARMNALGELSKTLEVNVDNKIEVESKATSKNRQEVYVEKNINSISRHTSNISVNNAQELESYIDENTGIYYILLCIK